MNNDIKVSVIIPTYNRLDFLVKTIESIKKQTYKKIEIIVINDCSTDKNYYTHDWSGVNIIHLDKNSKHKFGYPCVGYVRNVGISIAEGKYIAFCDDDDIWFPDKIKLQLKAMKKSKCQMCSTEGVSGRGFYNKNKKYPKHLQEFLYKRLQKIFAHKGYILDKFPNKLNLKLINKHNIIICSSVLMKKDLLNKIDNMPFKRRGQDWVCWKKALKYTDCIFVKEVCMYRDRGHGHGSNH